MSWKIITIAGSNDTYEAPVGLGDSVLRVPFNVPGDLDQVHSSIAEEFARFALANTPPCEDLLNFAVAAYTADVRVPRRGAFDSWTRDLELHLFVNEMERWMACRPAAEELLCFLTGDRWMLRLRPTPDSYTRHVPTVREVTPTATTTVALFSGGLDSFVGAIDLLGDLEAVTLVGHHSAGSGATSKSQTESIEVLRRYYTSERTPFFQAWMSPPKGETRASETTTRGRSILFLALGVGVAAAMEAECLVVPENGVISLNVPLTPSRLGSLSTRTTHPHTIELFRTMLGTLGIAVGVKLPYRFKTKGEMLRECGNQAALGEGVATTMSCAHPMAYRFDGLANRHCGRCVPCVFRRAALRFALASDPTEYVIDDLDTDLPGTSGTDLRVLRLALERFARRAPGIGDILKAGPLPGSDDEKREYRGVFVRGLAEIRALLQ